jgi:serine/threonine-protein kinase
MVVATAHELLRILRTSGLVSHDHFFALEAEVRPLKDDLPGVIEHVLQSERLTVYQLRKVLNGKVGELLVGPYIVLDRLGEGGMGRVYRARHSRVGHEVALKVVRSTLLANPVVRGRYEREVGAAGSLRHPNIVAVEDAGCDGGRYYLAMEFVDGIDLAVLTRDHRPLEVPEACEYIRQAALGLQHAHDAGFVHRDIKPSNVVVSGERHVPQATDRAVVKILDMGLVRVVGLDDVSADSGEFFAPADPSLTRDGSLVGTPDYMAPEQARDSRTVDHRADLYSLGCTLYFLLAGQPPFAEGTPTEKVLRHRSDQPPPLQALRPDVPTPVAAVVARLMAKDPADRFPTAAAVAAALAPLAVYPCGSQPVTIRVRPRRPSTGAETPYAADRSTMPVATPPVAEQPKRH